MNEFPQGLSGLPLLFFHIVGILFGIKKLIYSIYAFPKRKACGHLWDCPGGQNLFSVSRHWFLCSILYCFGGAGKPLKLRPNQSFFTRETFQCKKKHGLCTQRKCRINLLFFCLLVLLCFCYFLCWQNQRLMCWVLRRWSPRARFWLSWDGLLPPVLTWHPEIPVLSESSLGVH